MVATADAKRHAAQIVKRLKRAYPEVTCALHFKTPLQLLVATILSAQCTDTRVNIVTKDLFQKYPDAPAFAAARGSELERAVQSTGFFRNKAKNIKACCQELVKQYGSDVPRDIDALVKLPGIGRKTANVVLGTAFGIPTGVVVDTHVTRLSRRLGLTTHDDAVKIERDLILLVPRREWIDFSHRLIALGRQICRARRPKCDVCPLNRICPRIGVADRL
jgi:endonuclease III